MIQTINPKFGSHDKAKTAEIMSRYRPIAPKPEAPAVNQTTEESSGGGDADTAAGLPLGIRRSPYLMAVWHELQARPTRTRKRGKTLGPPLPEFKRSRFNFSPTLPFVPGAAASGYPPVFLRNPHHLKCGMKIPLTANSATVSVAPPVVEVPVEGPTEVDLVRQLEKIPSKVSGGVISPTAVRPVGSSIMVGMITAAKKCKSKNGGPRFSRKTAVLMKKGDVERELELERLPAVVSDSDHRVRLTNPAYNEMVGQPECPWLDIDIGRRSGGGGGDSAACRRIGGEVVLKMANKSVVGSSEAFSGWVRIEWGKKKEDGKMENAVNAYCEAVRLACDSDDYFIQWRFHVDKEKEKETSDHQSAA